MKHLITVITLTILSFTMTAQNNNIQLPQPQRTGGMPLMEALNVRCSAREYSSKDLEPQVLSNLLWAAWGYNRENKRTAPSSHNRQEMDLYVFLSTGTYIYNAKDNLLEMVSDKDWRKESGEQDFVEEAPVNIALIADLTKIKGKSPQKTTEAIFANAGFISQNIYLFCASEGLNTVTRAMVPRESLAKLLGLAETQTITLVQTVGYPK